MAVIIGVAVPVIVSLVLNPETAVFAAVTGGTGAMLHLFTALLDRATKKGCLFRILTFLVVVIPGSMYSLLGPVEARGMCGAMLFYFLTGFSSAAVTWAYFQGRKSKDKMDR